MDIKEQIEIWKTKAIQGELTQEEMREAVAIMREGREQALATPKKATTKKAQAPVDTDALMKQLEGL